MAAINKLATPPRYSIDDVSTDIYNDASTYYGESIERIYRDPPGSFCVNHRLERSKPTSGHIVFFDSG
jgi:hypothetical protein